MSQIRLSRDTRLLLDTNVLVRYADQSSPQNLMIAEVLSDLTTRGVQICVAPQNLIEFWTVATRPVDVNGLGRTVGEAGEYLRRFKGSFTLIPDTPAVFGEWEKLVDTHEVLGKQAHDCRLVAFMLVHQISHLLTFNSSHFRRFESGTKITVVEPGRLLKTT